MSEEKRRRSRVAAQFEVVILLDGEKIPVQTSNISMKGLLCTPDPRLLPGVECQVRFTLSRDIRFQIKSKVVRESAGGTAIDFLSMDESAFFHLRNIVRYSSQDADRIDRELQVPAFEPETPGESEPSGQGR